MRLHEMKFNATTTFILTRHGETEWNIQKRFQGRCDSPLTQQGREQGRALGLRMQRVQFDAIFASDSGRAKETASIIADFSGHRVQTDSRLRERHYGILEGLTLPEIEAQHADILNRLNTNDPDFIIPEGESHRRHYLRNVEFLEEKLDENAGKTLLLVAHGGVLDNFFRFVAGLSLDRPRCFTTFNAGLCTIKYGDFYGSKRWVIETWGDLAHLSDTGQFFGLG